MNFRKPRSSLKSIDDSKISEWIIRRVESRPGISVGELLKDAVEMNFSKERILSVLDNLIFSNRIFLLYNKNAEECKLYTPDKYPYS